MVEKENKNQTLDNKRTYSVIRGGEEIITNFGTGKNLYTILQSGGDETVQ